MVTNYSQIVVGGPCKITDGSAVMYTNGPVTLTPHHTFRDIPSSLGGVQDGVLVDLVWEVDFTPKSIYTSAIRGALLPTAYLNFTATGARIIGAANRAVTILGSDGDQYVLTRAIVTQMPELFLGLGQDLYGSVKYTAFLGNGNALTDTGAFFAFTSGNSWSQSDYPTGHQEMLCQAAWGAVAGWQTVLAEDGFRIQHELGLDPVKQGNITVDMKITKYRAAAVFKPQGPTSAQLLSALVSTGTGAFPGGIGTRLSANANDFVITAADASLTATVKNAALNRGAYVFDNKMYRHGEWAMITALTAPGNRLVLA